MDAIAPDVMSAAAEMLRKTRVGKTDAQPAYAGTDLDRRAGEASARVIADRRVSDARRLRHRSARRHASERGAMTNKPLAAQPARPVPQASQGAYARPAHSDFLYAIAPVTMFVLFFRPGLRLLTYDTPGASLVPELAVVTAGTALVLAVTLAVAFAVALIVSAVGAGHVRQTMASVAIDSSEPMSDRVPVRGGNGASGPKGLKALEGLKEPMERIIAGAVFGASVLDMRCSCIRRT
ncbi:hypothetical protein ACFPTO_03510 [Paraburkholderia denitrificans]|uniref:Uncharacterized protein n=1 Tax=Paraburkholderia denitrificans TaxID=694025 RepID=A0ABW0J4E8_9BURK